VRGGCGRFRASLPNCCTRRSTPTFTDASDARRSCVSSTSRTCVAMMRSRCASLSASPDVSIRTTLSSATAEVRLGTLARSESKSSFMGKMFFYKCTKKTNDGIASPSACVGRKDWCASRPPMHWHGTSVSALVASSTLPAHGRRIVGRRQRSGHAEQARQSGSVREHVFVASTVILTADVAARVRK
jgi:hypothetical protein